MSGTQKPEYIADHKLMVDIQVNAYVAGIALALTPAVVLLGTIISGLWLVVFCLAALALLFVSFRAMTKSLEARSLAAAHAVASMLTSYLTPKDTPSDE